MTIAIHSSDHSFVVVSTVGQGEWVNPSVEFFTVTDIEFSWENVVVGLTEINFSWSFRDSVFTTDLLLGLQKVDNLVVIKTVVGWGWESRLVISDLRFKLWENLLVIITVIGQGEWVNMSVEFLSVCNIKFSWEDLSIIFSKIWFNSPEDGNLILW